MTNAQMIWIAAGVAMLGLAGILHLRSLMRVGANPSWPMAQATVTHATVTSQRGGDGIWYQRFLMKYAYQVGARAYHGHFFSDKTENFDALTAKYPFHSIFAVAYSPRRPGHSDVGDPLGLMGGFSWRRVAYVLYVVAAVTITTSWFWRVL
jgi:hypothetical protein